MSYTELVDSSGISGDLSKVVTGIHWDIAVSCYEPLGLVTGGIGTYTRLLMRIFASDSQMAEKKIALFCRGIGSDLASQLPSNITTFEIPENREVFRKPATRIGSDHDWYSWNLAHFLLALSRKGHTFGCFEFPDYAVEGYFTLKMRRAGLLNIERIAVRLHSPELMLFKDNLLPSRAYDSDRLTRMSRELFCYNHCDAVFYGAPAMLDRVSEECKRFGVLINEKAVHIEHPYPTENVAKNTTKDINRANIHIGYIGRLEIRKGILNFLQKISENSNLRKIVSDLNIVFELFGADLPDSNGHSVKAQILDLHRIPELRGRIITHGYMPQAELKKKVSALDAYVFPSIFENYPNALLEVLHSELPILISASGGMPYISRGLPGVYQFSYDHQFSDKVEEFLCSVRMHSERPQIYFAMADSVNKSIAKRYAEASQAGWMKRRQDLAGPASSVDFVIPFYNDSQHVGECLQKLKAIIGTSDRIYIVDDASKIAEARALAATVQRVFGTDKRVVTHRMTVNSGPSAVRNFGARLGRGDFIQFQDADDYANADGFQITKGYLSDNDDVDFVYGALDNFGSQNHVWIPRDSSAMTCLDENYTHSGILIRRRVFEESGGFDGGMRLHYEDWQFNCKLALSGYKGEVVPFVTQHYRVREGSRTFRNLEREQFSREQVIDRTCMNRGAQGSMLEGELLEVLGKYCNLLHGRWIEGGHATNPQEDLLTGLSFTDLCNLEGERFVKAAYGVILGRHADPQGLEYYLDKLVNGAKRTSILADMLSSKEMVLKRRRLPDEYYRKLRLQRVIRHRSLRKLVPGRVLKII